MYSSEYIHYIKSHFNSYGQEFTYIHPNSLVILMADGPMEAPAYPHTTNRHTDTPTYTSQKTWLLDALHQTSSTVQYKLGL